VVQCGAVWCSVLRCVALSYLRSNLVGLQLTNYIRWVDMYVNLRVRKLASVRVCVRALVCVCVCACVCSVRL